MIKSLSSKSYQIKSQRKQNLSAVINGNSQTNRTRGQVGTNTTDIGLSRGVSVIDSSSVLGNRRANRAKGITDLHTRDRQTSILGSDNGDIEARPATVGSGTEVELAPGRSVATGGISRDSGSGGGDPATIRVLVEGNVDGLASGKSKGVTGVAVPACHLAIRAVLVEDGDGPVVGVGARELRHVFVVAGGRGVNGDDVAAVGVAHVAFVGCA